MTAEARERDVHRIEAFSDVVIGFSLAQIGVALVVPMHAADLVAHTGWLVSFAWTFALVCLLWWNHHRLFRSVFVPTTPAILLNFVLLATIVLLTFFAGVFNRPATLHDVAVAARLYYGALAANFLIWALLVAICVRVPEQARDEATSRKARRGEIIHACAGLWLMTSVMLSLLLDDAWVVGSVSAMVPLGFVMGVVVANARGYRRVREA